MKVWNVGKREVMNIYDIAKEAGVSISTVSRVMNHKGNVNPETRKKVEEILSVLEILWWQDFWRDISILALMSVHWSLELQREVRRHFSPGWHPGRIL